MNKTDSTVTELPPVRTVTFAEAFRLFITQYATFSGRATRSEYWCVFVINLIIHGIFALLGKLSPTLSEWLTLIYSCFILIPGFALFTRRMHDIGKRGWAVLWILCPLIGGFVILIWACRDSQGDNCFGPRKIET